VAQLGARLNGIQEVTGSIPVRSTNSFATLSRWLDPTMLRHVGVAFGSPNRHDPGFSGYIQSSGT
jgi:hypothetical protein